MFNILVSFFLRHIGGEIAASFLSKALTKYGFQSAIIGLVKKNSKL